jgi:hypothetical protein
MIIANIQTSKSEDHSIHSLKYGAGAVFTKYARILKNDENNIFYDFAPKECFTNIKKDERPDRCIALAEEQLYRLKRLEPIVNFLPHAKDIDIFIFNNDDLIINTLGIKATQVLWHSFVGQTCVPYIPNLFIYSYDQKPYLNPQHTNIFKVKIGKPPRDNFRPRPKENFIFQCTRNDTVMDTITTVKLCNNHGIQAYFGGPILDNYPLLEHINNKNTFYLGVLSEEEKLAWSSRARLYGCIQNWDTIFSLSAIEALGQGTPLICRERGCFRYLVEDGRDGFYFGGTDESFLNIWSKSLDINQIDCYNKALQYSEKEMVDSFYMNFERILSNKKYG